MSKRLLFAWAIVVLVALTTVASASTQGRLGLWELTDASSVVARVQVISSEARLEGRGVYTYISVRVDEPVKGSPEAVIEIRVPGGTIAVPGRSDGLAMRQVVHGAPRFRAGEESMVFLTSDPASAESYALVGLGEGKLAIDAQGMVQPMSLPADLNEKEVPVGLMPVDRLVERIRAHAEGGK